MSNTAFVVFAHGSSVETANAAVRDVARELSVAGRHELVEAAFLDSARPGLQEAVGGLVERGVRRIIVIPYFLTLGLHLRRDLPRIVERLKSIYHGVDIEVTPPLDGHPGLVSVLLSRADAALRASPDRKEE